MTPMTHMSQKITIESVKSDVSALLMGPDQPNG